MRGPIRTFIKDVDLRETHWVDYEADPRFADRVRVRDTLSLSINDHLLQEDMFDLLQENGLLLLV